MLKAKRRERGFTLIELLIVMVILGLLAALVAPRMFGKVGKSKQKAAKAQISLFETALDTYRLDVGKYPTTEQGLQGLREKPADVEKWDGPTFLRIYRWTPGATTMFTGRRVSTATSTSFRRAPTVIPAERMRIRT